MRPATPADLPALHQLEQASFAYDQLTQAAFSKAFTSPTSVLIVYDQGSALGGYVLVMFNRRTKQGRLYSIAVAEGLRGQGISKTLFDAAEHACKARGMHTLRLEVRADNPTLQAMYTRWGFNPCGTVDSYYTDGGTAVKMKKQLS